MNKCLLYIKLKTFAKKYTKSKQFSICHFGLCRRFFPLHYTFTLSLSRLYKTIKIISAFLYTAVRLKGIIHIPQIADFQLVFFLSLVCSFSFFLLCLNFRESLFFFVRTTASNILSMWFYFCRKSRGKMMKKFHIKNFRIIFFYN